MHTESEIEKLAAEYMEEGRAAFFAKELNKAATLTQNAIDIYRMEKNYEQYAYAQNMMGVIYGSLGNGLLFRSAGMFKKTWNIVRSGIGIQQYRFQISGNTAASEGNWIF